MSKLVPLLCSITFCLLFSNFVLAQDVIFLNVKAKVNADTKLPFSKATQVGELLFLSGELGIDPKTGKLVSGGIVAETKQLMSNIKGTLQMFGSDINHVAKCTVFLADIKDWPLFNSVYVTFFDKNFPARSALAASGLALGASVEVECIAVVK